MGDLTEGFLRYETEELKASPLTVEAYGSRLKALERHFGKAWPLITSDDLRALKRDSTQSSQTIAGQIVALRQAHKWGALEGLWELNGICGVRVPKVENEGHPPLPGSVMRKLLTSCTTPLEYRLVWLPAYAGTRVSESARIGEPEWLSEEGVLRFKGAKTGKVREVPVHPELEKVKAAILCSPVSAVQNLHRARRTMCKRLGLEFQTHSIRSTFSTEMEKHGAPWQVLMKALGHSLGTTGRYAFISRERTRDFVERLDYGLSGPHTEHQFVG